MINQVTIPVRCHCFARTWRGNRTGRVKRTTGCETAETRGKRTKGEWRRRRRRSRRRGSEYWQGSKNAGKTVEEGRGREGEWGMEENYTENISLLEKFSTPLSASIVIYARDEGGYITGFRLRRSFLPRTSRGWSARSSPTRSQKDSPNRWSIPSRTVRRQDEGPRDGMHAPLFDFCATRRCCLAELVILLLICQL